LGLGLGFEEIGQIGGELHFKKVGDELHSKKIRGKISGKILEGEEAVEEEKEKEKENEEEEQTEMETETETETETVDTDEEGSGSGIVRQQAGKRKKTVTDYEFGRVIGEGSFGQVRLAREKGSEQVVAIKILDKVQLVKENKTHQVFREKQLLESLHHPNIISLYATFQDQDHLYFVLEYCPNTDLYEHLKRLGSFNTACAKFYCAELVSVLEYLNEQGVVHRDIKPENLMLDANFHLKLIDFGTAKEIGKEINARSNSFVGTAAYISPELLNDHYSVKASDLWALGCVLYQLLCGRSPFQAESDFLTFRRIKDMRLHFPPGFPDDAQDLVEQLLVVNYTQRLGVHGGFPALKCHPFFAGIDWPNLHTQTPPKLEAPEIPIFIDEEKEREKRIQDSRQSVWGKFLFKNSNEAIVRTALVSKKNSFAFFSPAHKRQLILTDFPRLFYVDPERMAQKGEVEWSLELKVEVKSDTAFEIKTPQKTFYFEDEGEGGARAWAKAIRRLQKRGKSRVREEWESA
jgi:3-phosphoinositide dependent protein kinase-1